MREKHLYMQRPTIDEMSIPFPKPTAMQVLKWPSGVEIITTPPCVARSKHVRTNRIGEYKCSTTSRLITKGNVPYL